MGVIALLLGCSSSEKISQPKFDEKRDVAVHNLMELTRARERCIRVDSEPVKMTFAGTALRVPINYFRTCQSVSDLPSERKQFAVEVLLDSFRPQTTPLQPEFRRPGLAVQISVTVPTAYADGSPFTFEDELRHARPPHSSPRLLPNRSVMHYVEERRHGLACDAERIAEHPGPGDGKLYWSSYALDDICVAHEDGAISTYIECAAAKPPRFRPDARWGVPVPHCEHRFLFKDWNAIVRLRYRREHVENWRDIEARSRRLLRSFEIQKGDRF